MAEGMGSVSDGRRNLSRLRRKNIVLGNFVYSNPTKLYFGEDSLKYLNEELPKYGKTIQLIYGGGSIKRAMAFTIRLWSC